MSDICFRYDLFNFHANSLFWVTNNKIEELKPQYSVLTIVSRTTWGSICILLLPGMEWTLLRVLKLQCMMGEQQKITRVCTIKMSLFTVKSSWSCSQGLQYRKGHTKIKIKKKYWTYIRELKCNIELEIRFKTRVSFPGLRSRMFYILRKEIKMIFLNSEGNLRQDLKKKIGDIKT